MKRHILGLSVVLLALLLAGCNDSSSSSTNDGNTAEKSDVNVAAASKGATVTTNHNQHEAGHLIDEDLTTYWHSDPDEPIVVEFEQMESVIEFTLSRIEAGAGVNNNVADILIELSSDGTNYTPSIASFSGISIGGTATIACGSPRTNSTTMKCEMPDGHDVSHIRITSQNSKAYQFTQLEAIAKK